MPTFSCYDLYALIIYPDIINYDIEFNNIGFNYRNKYTKYYLFIL